MSYIDTLLAERRCPVAVVDGVKVPLNEGLLLWQPGGGGTSSGPPAPQCAVLDVLGGEYRPLMTSRGSTAVAATYASHRPTALLFWSQRCASSRKYLSWFVDFARHHVLMVCSSPSTSHLFAIMLYIKLNLFVICVKTLTVGAYCQTSANISSFHNFRFSH